MSKITHNNYKCPWARRGFKTNLTQPKNKIYIIKVYYFSGQSVKSKHMHMCVYI